MERETSPHFRNGAKGRTSIPLMSWLQSPKGPDLPAPAPPWGAGHLGNAWRFVDGLRRDLRLPAILAALALVTLSLAYLDVVNGAVAQGHARRQTQLSQVDAIWRCNAQRDSLQRSACRAELALTSGAKQAPSQDPEVAVADLRGL
jgi:hypothetical protein